MVVGCYWLLKIEIRELNSVVITQTVANALAKLELRHTSLEIRL